MNRRAFLATSAGTLTAAALAGCVPRPGRSADLQSDPDAAQFHGLRRYVRTDFGDIACVERGSGEAALFLHGFPLNGFQWRGALARLSPYRRCIAPDFLGMGYTRVADGQGCAPDDQVSMLVALLDALGVARVDVVANDSGGAVAQLLLARHGDRVRTLLLTNCDAENDCPPPALLPVIELARQGRFVDEWLGVWRANKPLARSAEGIGGMCYADPAHPTDEAIDTYFAPLLDSQRSRQMAHAYAVALERNVLEGIGPALKRAAAPTRIVWGAADTIFAAGSPRFLDDAFGNSRGVRLLADSKLFWPEERPDVLAEEALGLWGERTGRAHG
ncbi:alpha/beta fold hydrolase [Luteimonas suaedae]|uniref:alpha/beta fold hydrolase n=1 Tax=Luteimonas suaedae TaxID=2605430 RepID=UPI0011EFFE38|nr:alpha/beta hydrolase [Luteimonas suaedae]